MRQESLNNKIAYGWENLKLIGQSPIVRSTQISAWTILRHLDDNKIGDVCASVRSALVQSHVKADRGQSIK
jgi:hypothetical protein